MKLQNLNKKVNKIVEDQQKTTKTKSKKQTIKEIPIVSVFNDELTKRSFSTIFENLPDPIKAIIKSGNSIKSIKHNDSRILIKTTTNLEIFIKTSTINDEVPQCRIKNKNTREILIDTIKL